MNKTVRISWEWAVGAHLVCCLFFVLVGLALAVLSAWGGLMLLMLAIVSFLLAALQGRWISDVSRVEIVGGLVVAHGWTGARRYPAHQLARVEIRCSAHGVKVKLGFGREAGASVAFLPIGWGFPHRDPARILDAIEDAAGLARGRLVAKWGVQEFGASDGPVACASS
jgi:hypothetical protein